MLYDILAALWEQPAAAEQLHQNVGYRTAVPTSRQSMERYLRLLVDCEYLTQVERGDAQLYALAPRGSVLLADFAQSRERAATPIPMEA